jgi:hypothetical protein
MCGARFFVTGIIPTAIMAFPFHIIVILVYEYLSKDHLKLFNSI